MIDVFLLRIIAGILLASSFLLINVVNFTGDEVSDSHEAKLSIAVFLDSAILNFAAILINKH